MTEDFGVSQYPGGFFFFWNLVVPLSVLLNIRRFGIRCHEFGLILALSLNPYVLHVLMKSLVATTVVVWFLIIWIERILSRWCWYRIYCSSFARHTMMFLVLIAIPSLLTRIIWVPFTCTVRSGLTSIVSKERSDNVVDATSMFIASFLLMYAIMKYRQSFLQHRKTKRACKGNSPRKNQNSPRKNQNSPRKRFRL